MTQEDATSDPKAERPKAMRRWVFWLRAAFVVCLLPLVFVAAAAVMIIDRDITAPSWITERIEARAGDLLDDATLEFGAITLRIGRDLHPTVRLVDTRLVGPGGLTLTRVPIVEGLISPRGLILQQDVLMQEVRLIGAQVNLRRATNGDVSFAFSAGGNALGEAPSLPALLEQFDQVFERPALEALESVRADGLIINFDDARAGRSWIVDGGVVSLDLRGGETVMRGNFSLLSGRAGVTNVSLTYSSPRGSRAAEFGLNLDDAVASDIAAQSPALSWLRGVDAPITAALRTQVDADGALGPLNASLEIGQGVLQPNPATQAIAFEDARAYFTYDPARDLIAFSDISLQTEWGSLRAEGDAYLREFRDGLPRALLAQFQFSDIALNPPGFFETAPQLPEASIDLRLRFDPFAVEIGEFVVLDDDTRVQGSGAVTATDAGWQVALDAQINEITPERLVAFWPISMKPNARRWVVNNFTDGALFDVVAGLRAAPGRAAELAVGFEFAGSQIKFLRDIPPIRQAKGVASIEDARFVLNLDAGIVTAPEGGPLQLAGSHFTIQNMRLNPSPAVLELAIDSSLTAALSILNRRPFQYMDKANLPVTLGDGRAYTQGQVTWPLTPRPTPDDFVFEVTSEIRNVRSERLLPGRSFAAPRLDVTVSRAGVNIAGPVRIGDVAAVGAWDQRFGDPARPGSQVMADVALSQAFLDEFGIALPPGTIDGNGAGELSVDFQAGAPPAFRLTSDLLGLSVGIPAVGWEKGPNTAGNLLVAGTLGPVPFIETLEIGGGGLQASGQIDVDASGRLEAAIFSQLRIGDWFDAPITLRGRGVGQPLGVEIRGGSLDLRNAQFGGGQGEGGPVTIALDRLQVTEGIALTGFRGDFRSQDGFRGAFTGQLNGAAPVAGTVAPRDGRSGVRLRSDDAGAVLRAAGLMRGARGGSADLTLLPAGGPGTFDGRLRVRDIRVRDAPAMAALLDAISVVGLLQQLDGQGLAFDEVDARFRLTPQQVIISEASAVGPGLGISVDGLYTLASKQLDLQGVVSPFFLVNSIGSFLTRRGEGLIGFNYTIRGTTDAPQVVVNPLSALTPGMFREIFRRPAPDISQ
ncbi:AsmA-like C-terminal region-containing protein [Yoonia sp. F2084L]|uniref:AsmA-like C-terminal region-containing protein n=1 Tax=Yoonia sp. F2084L TaxID=2926419 RepID=UPI001FF22821|nr:AsmA-like C-terminal region-containing protein [Yoonia sp. F2084L]MCK0094764.1 AsmA-like C-terminal region-containing protein [Yoonia sp. F2084L]